MGKLVLVTGGAGFIGTHVADELIAAGYRVRVLDNLDPHAHGPERRRPAHLNPNVELISGDVRDAALVSTALRGVDAVYHLAARVGVGQSMYEVHAYTEVNNLGTAVLLETLSKQPVERLIVASSMSVYGEGLYRGPDGRLHDAVVRPASALREGVWEPLDDEGRKLEPLATPETKTPNLCSVYALSKFDQERTCMMLGQAYGIPTVALRLFNVYGPWQSLTNPYSGVLSIFAARIMSGRAPMLFEDGEQKRDFANIYDVAKACRLALEVPEAAGQIFNIGSGSPTTVRELAMKTAEVLGAPELAPEITQNYRAGDIRHCFPDISRARTVLGFEPEVSLERGLSELTAWLEDQLEQDAAAALLAG